MFTFESRMTPSERAERFFEMARASLEMGMFEFARRHFHTAMSAASETEGAEFERFMAEARAISARMQ